MSRLCSQAGEGVTIGGLPATDVPPPARRFLLGAWKRDFTTVFAVRAWRKARINVLEAESLNLGLSWVLRRPERHGKRMVILLDSWVALGRGFQGLHLVGPAAALLASDGRAHAGRPTPALLRLRGQQGQPG